MIDNRYRNAFKEVYVILQNTEKGLVEKIPTKFIDFLQSNMNEDYQTSINKDIEIDKQLLLSETEDVLALIYRSYWTTDEEKIQFSKKDTTQLIKIEEEKRKQYKDISEIFEEKRKLNRVTINNDLMVIEKENFISKILKKIFKK